MNLEETKQEVKRIIEKNKYTGLTAIISKNWPKKNSKKFYYGITFHQEFTPAIGQVYLNTDGSSFEPVYFVEC